MNTLAVEGFCRRCHQKIEKARCDEFVVVCDSCGHVNSNSEAVATEGNDKKFLKMGLAVAGAFAVIFVQIAVWDSYAIEIIPLKLKQLIGGSSAKDVERLAEICLERRRMSCVEENYAQMAKRDPKAWVKLAKFQMERAHYQEAVSAYEDFFRHGGKDLDASYQLAKALSQVGKADEAAKHYRYILSARPNALLQAATQHSYEKLLKERTAARSGKTVARGIASVPSRGIASVPSRSR